MPFGSLTAQQRAMILLELRGGPQYAAGMGKAAAATRGLGAATGSTGFAMQSAGRRTWLMNQAMFTFRRYAFYSTLAATSLAVGLIKLGTSYLSSMQTAAVALRPVFQSQALLNAELREMFRLGKYSPFVLADMTTAFRIMYPALHTAGMGVSQMNHVLSAMVDALSFAGKTSPGALNRVSYALQHMLFQGRLTGRVVQQLGMLGVPVLPILNRYLGVTADQLHNIAALNINPQSFLQAFVNFVETTPGYKGAALRLSLQSFHGLLQVTRDSLSQLMGILIAPAFTGGQSWLYNIAKPNGPLDRLANISSQGGFTAVIMNLSSMLTGGGLAGRGILLFTTLLHNLWRVFTGEVVPAFALALSSLVIFYPVLSVVNGILAILARHTTLVKLALIPLASIMIITTTAGVGLWVGTKLLNIALFGEMILVKNLWKQLLLLTTIEGRKILMDKLMFIWTLRNKSAMKALLFQQALVSQIVGGPLATGTFVYQGLLARTTRATWLAVASTKAFTIALLRNPFTWIAIAVAVLAAALYLVIFRMDLVKKKLNDIQKWFEKYSAIWRLIQWASGGSFTGTTQGGFSASKSHSGGGLFPGVNTWLEKNIPGYQWQEQFSLGGRNKGVVKKSDSSQAGSLAGIMPTGGAGNKPQVIQLVVDRKVLAEANAQAISDAQARK